MYGLSIQFVQYGIGPTHTADDGSVPQHIRFASLKRIRSDATRGAWELDPVVTTKRASDDPADRGEVIRRDSPTPYHRQLTDILEQRILDGVIPEKGRLPSELELADRFGLSRSTVRQALQTLVARGYAVRIANRGHFASTPPQEHGWMIQDRAGFLENGVGHHNRRVTTEVLSARREPFPAHACRALRLPEGSEGLVLVRRRLP